MNLNTTADPILEIPSVTSTHSNDLDLAVTVKAHSIETVENSFDGDMVFE